MAKDWLRIADTKMIVKGVVCLLLLAAIIGLQVWSGTLRSDNQDMLKFIKNEARYQAALARLEKREEAWAQHYLVMEPGADIDRLKSGYMNEILRVAEQNRLKADSYASEQSQDERFVTFHYTITAFGRYVDIVRFFTQIHRLFPFVYVKQFKMNKTGNQLVRLDLRMEIFGKAPTP